jgi:hypothetical protein
MSAMGTLGLTAGLGLLYAVAALVGLGVDARTLQEDSVWMKPLKFGLSTALYAGTLLWVVSVLSAEWRQGRVVGLVAAAVCVSTLFELVYIGVQAARGLGSHFNVATPFHAAMYQGMALAAVVLTASSGVLGMVALLDTGMRVPAAVRWGVVMAFVLSAVLTTVTGLTMGGMMTHHVGAAGQGAVRVPVTGWALTVGDLRVPHFLAMHLLQAGPLVGWLLSVVLRDGVWAASLVGGFCLLWSAVTVGVLRVVLAGRPFVSFLG